MFIFSLFAHVAWGQLTDELVDGASTNTGSSAMLEQWEERLDDIFNGRPHDIPDIALADTVQRFSLTIEVYNMLWPCPLLFILHCSLFIVRQINRNFYFLIDLAFQRFDERDENRHIKNSV